MFDRPCRIDRIGRHGATAQLERAVAAARVSSRMPERSADFIAQTRRFHVAGGLVSQRVGRDFFRKPWKARRPAERMAPENAFAEGVFTSNSPPF